MPQAENYLFTITLKNNLTGTTQEYAVKDDVAQGIADALAERADAIEGNAGTILTGMDFTESTGVLKLKKQGSGGSGTADVGSPVTLPCASYKARMDAIDDTLTQLEGLLD